MAEPRPPEPSASPAAPFGEPGSMVSIASAAIVATLVIVVLYVGRDILIPMALALLLSFVLSPLVSRAKKLGVPRTPAVVGVVLLLFVALFGLSALMAGQVGQLASDLPQYQTTMRDKIQSMRGALGGNRTLERGADMLQSLGKEFDAPQLEGRTIGPNGETVAPQAEANKPLPVEIHSPPPTALQRLQMIAEPLVHPLTTTGLIVIFVIFILLQREDLRNRLMSLAGARDIQRTTAALDDAAGRLSRLLLTQLVINASFGVAIGCGLALIGVPSALLWGIMAAVLRFVPYIGAFISAIFPLMLAAAVDPGWSMLILTAILFAVTEPLVGHVIEPLAYGRSTGLSPVAVVVAATFWTVLWGPIGLVLATPLTVCLVVLGRHVERLKFLDVMFGDRPSLTPPELFYQRLLARDPAEAAEKAAEFLKEKSLSAYYEEVAIPGLLLAQSDVARGALDDTRMAAVKAVADELVEDLDEWPDVDPENGDKTQDAEAVAAVEAANADASAADLKDRGPPPLAVRCVGGRTPIDQAAAGVVRQILAKHGMAAKLEGADFLASGSVVELDGAKPAAVCLVFLDPTEAHVRLAVRRTRRRAPSAVIVLGCWSGDDVGTRGEQLRKTGADAVATNLRDVVSQCLAIDRGGQDDARTAGDEAPARRVAPA